MPQHCCPKICDALSNIAGPEVIATRLGEWKSYNKASLNMNIYHYFWFHSWKEPKSLWHLNYSISVSIGACINLLKSSSLHEIEGHGSFKNPNRLQWKLFPKGKLKFLSVVFLIIHIMAIYGQLKLVLVEMCSIVSSDIVVI